MDETIETIFPSNKNYTIDYNQELNAHLQFQSLLDYSHHNQAIHSLSQLEFDHPDHPTVNDCCHNQVIDPLLELGQEDYQELGEEDYQVNPLPQSQLDDASNDSNDMSQTTVNQKGLSVDVLPQETSYLDYNVDSPNQELIESSGEGIARKLSWRSSTLGCESPRLCESPRQMSYSNESPTLMCESPKQMSYSNESPTLMCESPKQMSYSNESPTLMCESPKQMCYSSESSTLMCESPSQVSSYSNKSSTSVYKRLKRMSWNARSGNKSRKSSSENTKRCSWNDEAVKCLFLYLGENKDKIEKLSNPHSGVKEELWNGTSKWMLNNGHSYSPIHCRNKWKNNKQQYMNGILEKDPLQYKLVERILGHI